MSEILEGNELTTKSDEPPGWLDRINRYRGAAEDIVAAQTRPVVPPRSTEEARRLLKQLGFAEEVHVA